MPSLARGQLAALLGTLVLVAPLWLPAAAAGQAKGEAGPTAVSAERFRTLAGRAIGDPAALERLRDVERVGDREVDVSRLLGEATGDARDARLEALARPAPASPPDPGAARTEAAAILSQARFQPPDLPTPFRGVLESIGNAVRDAGEALGTVTPGGSRTAWVLGAIAVLALAALLASRAVRRRGTAIARDRDAATAPAATADPVALERAAEEAERRGEPALALRLRFRAGLLRLDASGAIRLRPSLPTAEVSRRLRSAEFDRLAMEFDAVAYGGRKPDRRDLEATRRTWSRVLEEVAPR